MKYIICHWIFYLIIKKLIENIIVKQFTTLLITDNINEITEIICM